ncbi:putative heavy metal-associated domain, HMA, heavy metal-associated domain superfamily [Helianthus annuus]|nr:putative heavy metal-associated domain, HMA, heavy metal-associated domain superfamily [Helianthus annuus]KAJ0517470.1 putative heavy metal-associated domain, HMA, heavy metal-associated domain superfamily [Helianthus annuus]KAJ0685480.1 putative heavy metal-associated domain, HMA, heavy metal-associated domain superfamily [Helianthus annuus]KAJ0689379.1 putative heavy metal-associated domain, HMA, heavy metal-associated domain superfamily [Helianthus annuus]
MASTEPPQPVKHKTCVLRVSIHCEGCKRKVNKILQSVPGVHDIVIERQNQRVVVTGDVTPESLLRKLVKSGKHAELWPENPQNLSRRTEKVSEFGGKVAGEKKVEEKKTESGSASDSAAPPVVEKQTGDDGAAVGGGEEKKKKKKKKEKEGQKSNLNSIGEASSSAPPQQTKIRSSNQSPPRQHGYKYLEPYHHGPPPAPVYTVSYNTAHPPVNSYTASYYAAAPPQSYAYSHYGSAMAPPPPLSVPSDYYESYAQQQGDSFEMFSDENPNGCYVM